MASADHRKWSKKNICDITRQLALASDGQRLLAMASASYRLTAQKMASACHRSPALDIASILFCAVNLQLALAIASKRWPSQVFFALSIDN